MKHLVPVIIFFCFSHLHSQVNELFVKHLSKNNLRTEHGVYLNGFAPSDSLNFYKAKFFFQYNEAQLFLQTFSANPKLIAGDTGFLNLASVYFLRERPELSARFFSAPELSLVSSVGTKQMMLVYHAAEKTKAEDSVIVPRPLRSGYLDLVRYSRKKPFVAGLLSAAVPGLGKLYAGRKYSFINTLVVHAFFAAAGVEAVSRLGWKHPYTIFNLSYSGVFYLANIYASAREVKRVKKEKRKQFLNDAADYFDLHFHGGLYSSR